MATRLAPRALWLLAFTAAVGPGCSDLEGAAEPQVAGDFVVLAPPRHAAAARDFMAGVGLSGAAVVERDDPGLSLGRGQNAVRVALVDDGRCEGCFQLKGSSGRYVVRGGGVLGVQYGLAQLLEEMGVRFFHPDRTHVPARLASPDASPLMGVEQAPEMKLRGLHLHTLHPIEAYFDVWEPGEQGLAGARRIVDWTVKNRGNFLTWPALDNIDRDAGEASAWREHTRKIIDHAHSRGVAVGLGVQLFGSSSLQRSLTLLKGPGVEGAAQVVKGKLELLLGGLPVDQVNLSFGEFSGVPPEDFISSANLAREQLRGVLPGATMSATVHVGNYPDLRVDYKGENLLYYFLIKHADPTFVPWVHTVMYYNLFEDAGGAYLHDQFSEHRAYLIDRLRAGQPVAYKPETAYWVAFDNSVPTYLPLYIQSRHTDAARLRKEAGVPLGEQVIFTSGWEWGYWQNDYATLRLSYRLPDDHRELVAQMFSPWGAQGQALSTAVNDLAQLQHRALIEQRLAPYLAGRDFVIDLGEKAGKIAAPTRPSFDALGKMEPAQQQQFETEVIEPLAALASGTEALGQKAAAAPLAGAERFHSEIVDGTQITALRASFIGSAYRAALAHARGQEASAHVGAMEAALEAGKIVVARRHADLHSPRGAQLHDNRKNSTLYGYGYLREAHSLCYWRRELSQVRSLVLGEKGAPPGCVL